MKKLRERLEKISGKSYGAYKLLKGQYSYGDFNLIVEHVQGDPFAKPSNVSVRIPFEYSRFPMEWFEEARCLIPLGDFLTRNLSGTFRCLTPPRFAGNGGRLFISDPGQQILPRSSVTFELGKIVIRFRIGLPAHSRNIDAEYAGEMFFNIIPQCISETCFNQKSFIDDLNGHINIYKQQMELRDRLEAENLIGFIPDGARLPRASGALDTPLEGEGVVDFESPPEMKHTFNLSGGKTISGMGIKKGVNLIVGGGFHGKSTLLSALELGIYSHIPGDGREFVCALDDTLKVRSENGRVVNNVNIEYFIRNLPQGTDTRNFSTLNASGSTSQAASILEGVNAGVKVLLMDEDTCATNFMIRDEKMRSLIQDDEEPITPFLHRVEGLYRDHGVSSILVMGGSGDYFACATDVIAMKNFLPRNLYKEAREISGVDNRSGGMSADCLPCSDDRTLLPCTRVLGTEKIKVRNRGLFTLCIGRLEINIRDIEQIVCEEQVITIGNILYDLLKKTSPIPLESIRKYTDQLRNNDFTVINTMRGDYACVRYIDLINVINRTPGLEIVKAGKP